MKTETQGKQTDWLKRFTNGLRKSSTKLSNGIAGIFTRGRLDQEAIEQLEEIYPGIKDRLLEDGDIAPNIAVAIDGDVAIMGLLQRVGENSEVHFVPAIGGGF